MRITLTSVLVDDQAKALRLLHARARLREEERGAAGRVRAGSPWSAPTRRTASSSLLEPDQHPAARPFKEALVADGIPFTAFTVDDVEAEHARLTRPASSSPSRRRRWARSITAVLDDTCGNLIQIVSPAPA